MSFVERFCNSKDALKNKKFIVVGDFCLDRYMYLDSRLDQRFDYCDLDTYFMYDEKLYPGGAGNVAKNILSMGATVICIGLIGNDGNGYDLKKVLKNYGADVECLYKYDDRITNTYYRPIRRSDKKDKYMNELLFINPKLTGVDQEKDIIDALEKNINVVDGIVIVEQFDKDGYSSITPKVKKYVNSMANKFSDKFFLVDSRSNINKYTNMYVKCNQYEFMKAMHGEGAIRSENTKINIVCEIKKYLGFHSNRGIYVTLGRKGIAYGNNELITIIDAFSIVGETDTCGAGDSASAGIIAALCMGYSDTEAMVIGNLCAYVTVKQIGVTGIITYERLIQAYKEIVDGIHM